MFQRKSRHEWVLWAALLLPVWYLAIVFANIPESQRGLLAIIGVLPEIMSSPLSLRWGPDVPRYLLIFTMIYAVAVIYYYSTRRKTRVGEEYGSAKWGDAVALGKKYKSKKDANLILTQNVSIGIDNYVHGKNLNTLVVGGSGAGKTRFFAKPRILEAAEGNVSFIITDPKGEILRDTGELLKRKGYEIRIFDLIDPKFSMCFNPLEYVEEDNDVIRLITNLIENTTPPNAQPSEPFWIDAEKALLMALCFLLTTAPKNEQNFEMVMELLRAEEVPDENAKKKPQPSVLDVLFQRLSEKDPDHIALKQYAIYKQAQGKTASSILVSTSVRLATFNIASIAAMTRIDEMDLGSLGEKKVALFCLTPDNDNSLGFLVSMLYTCCFQELSRRADRVHNGRLPVHVHCIMDEFPNLNFPQDVILRTAATSRGRGYSMTIICQTIAQLKAKYNDDWETLVGLCDSFLYLGGNEFSSYEHVSKLIGHENLDTTTYSHSKGSHGSYSVNYQGTGRELLFPEEVRKLPRSHCILFIASEDPVVDLKYNLLSHPNVKHTPDGGAQPYRHGYMQHAKDNIIFIDLSRLDDYELLSMDEPEQEKETQQKENIENESV